MNDLGIDQNQLVGRILAIGHVDDGDLLREADLRRGEAHPFGGVHGFEHVLDELVQLRGIEFGYVLGLVLQHRIAKLHNRINHKTQKLLTCSR